MYHALVVYMNNLSCEADAEGSVVQRRMGLYEGCCAGKKTEGEAMPVEKSRSYQYVNEAIDDCHSESKETAYGCCFCLTGKEQMVVEQIHRTLPDVHALVARREKHKSVGGKKKRVEEVMLPGYVFFEAPKDMEPFTCFPREYIVRILAMENNIWQLIGEDMRFARWLFQYNGLIGFSKAYKEGERIRIISGPLKDMEGNIIRVDKRGRSGQVILEFSGNRVPVWLGFELVQGQSE